MVKLLKRTYCVTRLITERKVLVYTHRSTDLTVYVSYSHSSNGVYYGHIQ